MKGDKGVIPESVIGGIVIALIIFIIGTIVNSCNTGKCKVKGCNNDAVSNSSYCSYHRNILATSTKKTTAANKTTASKTTASSKSSSKTTASSKSSSSKKSTSSDPYNAKNYSDYEDFYYDNIDDFDGIDDAEDYYDSHH